MDHYWYTRAIGNHDPAEQCKPEIGILLWRETRVVGMARLFVGVSTGEVDGEGSGLAGESSTIALSLSAPVNAATALIPKFGGGGLGGGTLLWLSSLYGARFIKR